MVVVVVVGGDVVDVVVVGGDVVDVVVVGGDVVDELVSDMTTEGTPRSVVLPSSPHVPVPSAYTGVTAPPSLHVMQSAAPVGQGRYPHVPHDAWHAQFATGTPGRAKHPPDASAATP